MKSGKLSYVAILYIITWIVSPPLAYNMFFRVLAIIAIVICVQDSIKYASVIQKKYLVVVLGICAYVIGVAIFLEEDFYIKIGSFVLLLTGVSFDMWLSNKMIKSQQLHFIIFFTLFLFCMWNSTTLSCILFENGRIMRDLTQNSDFSETYALRGVGGFGYIYSVVLMLPVSVELLRYKGLGRVFRIVNMYFVITGFMLAYFSEYFIAFLLSILIILLIWKKPSKFTFIVLGVITLLVFFVLEFILGVMIDMIDVPEINKKLIDVRDILVLGNDVEDTEFGVRYERYLRDVGLMFSNPIWGSLSFKVVGKHSEFLDFFAQYGIPLGCLYVSTLLRPATIWVKRNVQVASVVLLVVIIMCMMNRFPITSAAPLCFFLPTFCKFTTYMSKR